MKRLQNGFTLIELLIVVAIIAILAAIAVPNFLEAQTRAKIARCRADMRSASTGIESYHIDYGTYLYCNLPANVIDTRPARPNSRRCFERLTTPISYLSSIFIDPFNAQKLWNRPWTTAQALTPTDTVAGKYYHYTARNNGGDANARWDEVDPGETEAKPVWYLMEASGPDGTRHNMADALNFDTIDAPFLQQGMYDATNGTVSRGSIWRVGGGPGKEKDRFFYNLVQGTY